MLQCVGLLVLVLAGLIAGNYSCQNCTYEIFERILREPLKPGRPEKNFSFPSTFNNHAPIGILVDSTENSLDRAYQFISHVKNDEVKFVMMKFNNTDTSDVIAATENNNEAIKNQLYQWKSDTQTTSFLDLENMGKGVAFFGMLKISKYLPNLKGETNLQFPVDASVVDIHISISSTVGKALLTTPDGVTINLLKANDVEDFSYGSFLIEGNKTREIHLNIMKGATTLGVGMWRLHANNFAAAQLYEIVISVQTKLTTNVTLNNLTENFSLDINGPKKINEIKLVDGNGEQISEVFLRKDLSGGLTNEFSVKSQSMLQSPLYVQINGKDTEGNNLTRLAYINSNKDINKNALPSLSVEVGVGSQLLVASKTVAKIYFEVTNNREQISLVRFKCRDTHSWLVRLDPLYAWINPQQTIIVTLIIRAGVDSDLVTFTALGSEVVEKAAHVRTVYDLLDNEEPKLNHRYTSDCTNVVFSSCEGGTWTVEVTAQDIDTGLLQLTSNPKGLYFPKSYIAGTKNQVIGYYTGSCCQPKLQLTAIDLKNNRNSYTADAYNATLGAAAIAAIVLGLTLLIIIIIVLVMLCRRKWKESRTIELSTYRGPNTESRY